MARRLTAVSALKDGSLLLVILVSAALGACCVGMEIWTLLPSPAETRFCDRQVALLLDSRDPLEVQRAGMLVREIPCDVARRIAARAP